MGICFPEHFIFLFGSMLFPLHARLGLPQLLSFGVIHCICGWPLNLVRTHFLHCSRGGERIASHNVIEDALHPLQMKHGFIFHMNKFMSFQHLPFNFLVGKLTLCYQLMTFAPWLMCSLSIPHEQIGFHVLLHLARWSWWWQFKQMKDFTTNDTQ
jgi:hypothetical protein